MAPQEDSLRDADGQPACDTTGEQQEKMKKAAKQRSSYNHDDKVRQHDGNGRRKHPLDRDSESPALAFRSAAGSRLVTAI